MVFELAPVEPVSTEAEVVCVRREGAYLRLADWCPWTLMLLRPENYPVGREDRPGVTAPRPASGIVYAVQAVLPPKPVQLCDFRLDFYGEIETWGPKAAPPPACLPGPGEELPLFAGEHVMHALIQSAVREKLSKESLTALAYLVRRAHGLGRLAKR